MTVTPEHRLARLEQELVEQAAAYERKLAEAQERLYWLDRWGIDLNDLMERRRVRQAYGLAQRIRRLQRRLLG